LTVSSEDAKPVLREALAMGADKAYVVNDSRIQGIDTLGTARILAEAIRKIGQFDLILCGETSLDSFSGLVGSRLSELLSLPQETFVRKVLIEGDMVIGERTLEDVSETVKTKMPALVTVTREINQPRIPSLMMIMKASKKEIVTWTLSDLNVNGQKIEPKIEVLSAVAPAMERKRIMITDQTVREIAEKLAKALLQEGIVGK
jgi:electron transfer flavoprotein beta subunit